MNLQFTNKGGNFVSEFEVSSGFNLHIEGVRLSDMRVYQKTAGGLYAIVTGFPTDRSADRVADFDFASLVYPKIIKVVCPTEPTYAEIATDGEVTEIKSQSKEVEITANGVTEIAPDAGFGYLNGVTVNVNVPQSGGDAPSQPSGGSSIEYLDVSDIDIANGGEKTGTLIATCYHMNGELSSVGKFVLPIGQVYVFKTSNLTSVKYLAFDFSSKYMAGGMSFTIKEALLQVGWTEAELDAIPRVTKEEFYTI